MAAKLSDEELREKLKEFDEDVGPITDTTRPYWRKKLDQHLTEEKNRHRKMQPNIAPLAQYSSDDSEADGNSVFKRDKSGRPLPRLKRRTSNRTFTEPTKNSVTRSQNNVDGDFKKPTGAPKSSMRNAKSQSLLVRPSLRSTTSNHSTGSSVTSNGTTVDFESSDSDIEEAPNRRSLRGNKRSSLQSTDVHNDSNTSYSIKSYGPRTSTPCRSEVVGRSELNSSTSTWEEDSVYDTNHVSPKVNGYSRMDESSFSAEFRTEDNLTTNTNFSQWISMILLAVVTLFFICVAILYLRVRHKDLTHTYAQTNFNSLLCRPNIGDNYEKCIPKTDLPVAVTMSKHIHKILRQTAGAFECNEKNVLNRHLTYGELKAKLRTMPLPVQVENQFSNAMKNALLLIKENPSWGIRLRFKESKTIASFFEDSTLPDTLLSSIATLESVTSDKSLFCRITQAIRRVFLQVFMAVFSIAAIFGLWKGVRYYKWQKETSKKLVYAMVEKIIDYLQQYNETCQNNQQMPPYVAVLHLRDMLIPPSERKSKQWLWNRAVKFLEENESRVRVEQQSIEGEEFKVWRWLQPTTPEGSTKKGKVWQGPAFGNSGKAMNFPSYNAPCLKIRNMFDPDVEYEDRWHVMIEDAILEKCEGINGIVHIKVDTSSKEGCVYVKCTDPESAGKVYRALHGWWFDGKLVTVKYLRLQRYHERFPESQNYATPLKPSNNMRLSLSEPFHSSALERS